MISKHCVVHSYKKEKFKLSIADSIDLVNHEHWSSIVEDRNVYLSQGYLKSLESTLETIDFRYILFYDSELTPVGVAVVQLHRFKSGEVDFHNLSNGFSDVIPYKIFDKLESRVMLCGNAFSTGENGFLFCKSVPEKLAVENLIRALHRIKKDEKKSNDQVSLVLLKDFWPKSAEKILGFEEDRFQQIDIDVNMVLSMQPTWLTWEDYLSDLTTKFRTRVKGVYKKSSNITSKSLTATEIVQYSSDIDDLYSEVVGRAKFNLGTLKAPTFHSFKEQLPDLFFLTAYFNDGKMIGFSTSFLDDQSLEANFVGLRYDVNNEYALYQRMLYDFVKRAIDLRCTDLQLGRTAEEIKSNLGAEPVEMKLLIKHRNAITNKLMKPFVEAIGPSSFDMRKPFKAVVYDRWIR